MAAGAARRTRLIAWANAVVHAAGLALTATWMRPGTVLAPRADRIRFLADRPWEWTFGWSVWALCALAIVALMWSFWAQHRGRLFRLALVATITAAAFDLVCDYLWIVEVPRAFDRYERVAYLGGAAVANGLYTAGVLLAALALRERVPRPVSLLGAAVVAAGVALSLTSLVAPPLLVAASAGAVIGLYAVWGVAVAHTQR